MFDTSPRKDDGGIPLYTWRYISILLDAYMTNVLSEYPNLIHEQGVFVSSTTTDHEACARANWSMVVSCLKINFGLHRDNGVEYDTLMQNLNARSTAYYDAYLLATQHEPYRPAARA